MDSVDGVEVCGFSVLLLLHHQIAMTVLEVVCDPVWLVGILCRFGTPFVPGNL